MRLDFGDLLAASGGSVPSVILIRTRNQTPKAVTPRLVRACDGPEQEWRRRWIEPAAQIETEPGRPAPDHRSADGRTADGRTAGQRLVPRRRVRSRLLVHAALSISSAAVALALAGLTGWFAPSAAASHEQSATSARRSGLPNMYVGVSLCDPGSRVVQHRQLALRHSVRLGSSTFPAGTVVGTVYLLYSPRCSEGWPHFSPAAAFFGRTGTLTLRSVSSPDDSVNTSATYRVIPYAEGEPMLTVLGCVSAEATISFGSREAAVTAVTNCFQRA